MNNYTEKKCLECAVPGGTPRHVTDEQMAAGRRSLGESFVRLLSSRYDDNLYWVGLQTDLLEVVRIVFDDGLVRDPVGVPLPLLHLVRHSCAVFHQYMPRNPYSLMQRARRRKGIRRQTMLERYCWRKYVQGVADPLADEVLRLSADASPLPSPDTCGGGCQAETDGTAGHEGQPQDAAVYGRTAGNEKAGAENTAAETTEKTGRP